MRYVAAYLLAVLGGNTEPSTKDIKKILDTVGVDVDNTALDKVVAELKGKNIEELIAEGRTKLASVPTGGAVAGGAAVGGGAAEEAPKEEKKEEKKEESEDEEDDDMGFGLFD